MHMFKCSFVQVVLTGCVVRSVKWKKVILVTLNPQCLARIWNELLVTFVIITHVSELDLTN